MARLSDSAGLLISTSSLYETAPVGGPPQGSYLNAVVVVDTSLAPRALLDLCLEVESQRGRERTEPLGPRTLDLDLLVHGQSVIDEPGLVVPHPRISERGFVLEPLAEIWGGGPIPGIADLERARVATSGQDVRLVAGPGWSRPRLWELRAVPAVAIAGLVAAGLITACRLHRRHCPKDI